MSSEMVRELSANEIDMVSGAGLGDFISGEFLGKAFDFMGDFISSITGFDVVSSLTDYLGGLLGSLLSTLYGG